MKNNVFSDDDSSDSRTVDVTNLSKADQAEISKYALAVINSARAKFGKKAWTYSSHALRFANVVAKNYNADGCSVWDATHDVAGIERAAKTCGLNSKVGQVYEVEWEHAGDLLGLRSAKGYDAKTSNLV